MAVIPTAPERARNRDTHYPYRYDSYFHYLTGFQEPEAVLVIVADAAPRTILFCRERNAEREIWDGFRHGPEGARERFGFDEAQPIAQLDEAMTRLARGPRRALVPRGRRPGVGRARDALAERGARQGARAAWPRRNSCTTCARRSTTCAWSRTRRSSR